MEIEDHITSIIEPYNSNSDWKKVQAILEPYAIKRDAHELYLINYAIALYYDFNYTDALIYSSRAFKKQKNDPFILYHHGVILMCNKKFNDAIKVFKRVMSFSEEYMFEGEFSGGKRWGQEILNNVIYYLAKTYFYKNDLSNAIKFYKVHISKRKKGIPSFITKREVVKELNGAIFLKEYERKYPEKAKGIIEL